jgi:putative thioredoxin
LIRVDGVDAAKVMAEAIEHPHDVQIQMECADIEVAQGDLEEGFKRLLALVSVLSGDEQKRVKDRLLEFFALVDSADPRVIKARAALANALF